MREEGWILCQQGHPALEAAATGRAWLDMLGRIVFIGTEAVLIYPSEAEARQAAAAMSEPRPVPYRVTVEVEA